MVLLGILPVIVGSLSGYLSRSADRSEYDQLNKPWFNPPGWIFGPVWLILYILMGVSAEMVKTNPKAINIFLIQLALNFSWSIFFFNLNRRDLALLIIVSLFVSIVYMMKEFSKTNMTAARLQIPYLLWVGFATILNISIWWLNRKID